MTKLRVVLVDDHTMFRAGIRQVLSTRPDVEVAGEANDASSALTVAHREKPDVLLLDVSMPGGGGMKALEELRRACPSIKVIVLTMHDDIAYLRSMLGSGATGYVLKTSPPDELLRAIDVVAAGRVFVDTQLGDALVQSMRASPPSAAGPVLSARESEVLVLLARGYTNKEASVHINVSVKTIETYRTRLTTKLGLRTRADLVRYAFQAGLLASLALGTKD